MPGLSAPCSFGRYSSTGTKHSAHEHDPRSREGFSRSLYSPVFIFDWSCLWTIGSSKHVHLYLCFILASPLLDSVLRMSLERRSEAPLHVLYSLNSFLMKGIDFNNVSFCVLRPVKSNKKHVKGNVKCHSLMKYREWNWG